jgi:hypothetical protein
MMWLPMAPGAVSEFNFFSSVGRNPPGHKEILYHSAPEKRSEIKRHAISLLCLRYDQRRHLLP